VPKDADVWFPEDDEVLPLLLPRWRKWAKEVRLAEEAGPDPGESRFFVGSLDSLMHAPSGAACQRPLSLNRPQKIRLPLTLNSLFRFLATAGESELAATGSLALVMTKVPGHPKHPCCKNYLLDGHSVRGPETTRRVIGGSRV
jgi:hypothetical protein